MSEPTKAEPGAVLAGGIAVATRLAQRYPNAPKPVYTETTEEARERRERALATRLQMWRVPPKFADATLDSLTPAEDPEHRVSRWLDGKARNLILWSTVTGNGKSHAAHAIGNTAVRRGTWAATWALTRLNKAFRPGGDEAAYDVACMCDLLVLDDVGGESISEWTLDRLLDVLDARTGRTIFTTNLTGEALVNRYGRRITDRMIDGAHIVEFTGPSWREPAPW